MKITLKQHMIFVMLDR